MNSFRVTGFLRSSPTITAAATALAQCPPWRWTAIRSFVVQMNRLSKAPAIATTMRELGMQSIFEGYWTLKYLRKIFPPNDSRLLVPQQKPQIPIFGLAPIPFHDPIRFAWVKNLEAKTDLIAKELENLLVRNKFYSYHNELGIDFDPRYQQNSNAYSGQSWNVFYLSRLGKWNDAAIIDCPETYAALSEIPELDLTMTMFSALRGRTWIPPHYGLSNALLRVHLPLIVPPHCSLRVGPEKRQWERGKVLIFDDSYEHEVWNDSSETRVVLFFNIFHPAFGQNDRIILRQFFNQELPKVPLVGLWNKAQETGYTTTIK